MEKLQDEMIVLIPLDMAKFCVQCEILFNMNKKDECPACGSKSTIFLRKWLNKE